MPASADELVELLDLELIDVDLYRGRQPQTDRQRVFGGQVAAQALLAGIRSVDPAYVVHSLHSYFLRAGDHSVPIVYDVERLRDGRSFATRRVVARQHGRPIYFQTANFQRAEDGLEHADEMPDALPPEKSFDLIDVIRQRSDREADAFAREWAALEMRYVGVSGLGLPLDPARPAQARLWARVNGQLSDDAVRARRGVHLCQRPDPARRGPGAARDQPGLAQPPAGLARPLDLVPPAVPGRRVVALRPVVADGRRRTRPRPGAGSSPRTGGWSPPSPRRA